MHFATSLRRASAVALGIAAAGPALMADERVIVTLPFPTLEGKVSVERALGERRTVREFAAKELTLSQVAQLLWACQGVTDRQGFRTAPSAGALYPLEVYLLASDCVGLEPGLYRYLPNFDRPALEQVRPGRWRDALAAAALGQECIRTAPANMVITVIVERTAAKYGNRAERYAILEAGHAAQNVCLQATALGLGVTPVGAFDDGKVSRLLGTSACPLYILAVGVPSKQEQ